MVFANSLADNGAHVVLADMDQSRCDHCAGEIFVTHQRKALGIKTDVSVPGDVNHLVEEVISNFGQIDILINNAAAQPPGMWSNFEDYPLELWNRVMSVNLTGQFLMAQRVGREMLKRQRGSIINISSVYGVVGPDFRIYEGTDFNCPAVYSASKAGVLGLTRYLASYWGKKGIRVNSITPGGVFRGHKDPFLAQYSARVPMGRMADEKELQGAVIYLASDSSSYVTGHNLVVDGGWTTW
jgi:NAD(P)-dependent dehydrogenase (short-subunit alcohol dehydrogenase family)